MSLLSIVTRRHPKRDSLFKICKESLQKQTCQNFEHVLIIDDVGRGVEYANKSFYKNREKVTGKYVFILDDDDVIINPNFVASIQQIDTVHNPDLIMVMGLIDFKVFPTQAVWFKRPIYKDIGSFNFVVKNELWQRHIKKFGTALEDFQHVAGDFHFIDSVWSEIETIKVIWNDTVYCMTQKISRGQAE